VKRSKVWMEFEFWVLAPPPCGVNSEVGPAPNRRERLGGAPRRCVMWLRRGRRRVAATGQGYLSGVWGAAAHNASGGEKGGGGLTMGDYL